MTELYRIDNKIASLNKIFNNKKSFLLMSGIVCFLLYALRTPEDLFKPYLWAEDGSLFISDTLFSPLSSFLDTCNGSFSVLQRLLTLICYIPCYIANDITYLPIIMGVLFKLFAVIGILYFTSDRFAWLIESRIWRLAVCIFVILTIPPTAYDLVTCDASLPHVLLFTVYLIGLRLVCVKDSILEWDESIIVFFVAFSSAAAPFMGLIGMCHIAKTLMQAKNGDSNSCTSLNVLKGVIVLIPVILQCRNILNSSRVSTELQLFDRLLLNTKNFVFFPFWQYYHRWIFFIVGLGLWFIIMKSASVNPKFLIYSCACSFFYMLYCSMTVSELERIYGGNMVGRFIYLNVALAALMLGVAAYCFWEKGSRSLWTMGIAGIVLLLAIPGYRYIIDVKGTEYSDLYAMSSVAFTRYGDEVAFIPVGPGGSWEMKIPVSLKIESAYQDLIVEIRSDETGVTDIRGIPRKLASGGTLVVDAHLNGSKLRNLFFQQEDGVYQSTWTAVDEGKYSFLTPKSSLSEGYDIGTMKTLIFYGQSEDGAIHRCVIDL